MSVVGQDILDFKVKEFSIIELGEINNTDILSDRLTTES